MRQCCLPLGADPPRSLKTTSKKRWRRLSPGQNARADGSTRSSENGSPTTRWDTLWLPPTANMPTLSTRSSIVPRGRAALGFTLQLPTEEQFVMTRSELMDKLKGLLGGRAAEETIFAEISTGAENDLERATTLARQMVCIYWNERSGWACSLCATRQ